LCCNGHPAKQSSGKTSMPKQNCNRWALSIGLAIFAINTSVVPANATQHGKASWYAMTSITASGERASPNTMTAAHRTLDFGTQIRVTNIRNGRSVILCVNDRGPFIEGRIVDVTKVAARKLGFENAGLTNVRIDVTGRKSRRCS
jgi:rare lipoprotein A